MMIKMMMMMIIMMILIQAQSEAAAAGGQYKCLTQFKMAESSTSEASTEEQEQEQERVYVNVHRSGEEDEEMTCDDDPGDPYCGPGPEMKTGERPKDETHPDLPGSQIVPSSSAEQTCHESEDKCVEEGESFVSAKQADTVTEGHPDDRSLKVTGDCESRSIASSASSRKSDVGTNTDPGCHPLQVRNLRNQDPFGSSRKLTLRRSSGDPGEVRT